VERKPFYRSILFIGILLATNLSCRLVMDFFAEEPDSYSLGEPSPIENEPQPDIPLEELPFTETLTCPKTTEKILQIATESFEDESEEYGDEPEQVYLVSYSVSSDQLSDQAYYEDVPADLTGFQEDEKSHQEIWDYFITLIPAGERSSLVEYVIVTDGESNNLAAVAQTTHDPGLWSLEVDIVDSEDKFNLIYTLIHEYAHLLTLGSDQVTPSLVVFNNPDDDDIYYNEVSKCPDYFPGEGCSQSDSYINVYFTSFWADIHDEWQDINLIEDDDAYYEALDDFYYRYEDRFVTDYASTNPEEDIAEAFTFFVLAPYPSGDTIAEKKILFFYNYPELVQLRDTITTGICSLNQ